MNDAPEQVGEFLVFEQVGVFKKAEQEIPFHDEEGLHSFQVSSLAVHLVVNGLEPFLQGREILLAPVFRHKKVVPNPLHVDIERREPRDKLPAYLCKKESDDHIEFEQEGLLLPVMKKLVDDHGHKEDLDEYKGNIPNEINEDVMGVAEQQKMNRLDQRRKSNQQQPADDAPFVDFYHNCSLQ